MEKEHGDFQQYGGILDLTDNKDIFSISFLKDIHSLLRRLFDKISEEDLISLLKNKYGIAKALFFKIPNSQMKDFYKCLFR